MLYDKITRREFFKFSGLTSLFIISSARGINLKNSIFTMLDDNEKICDEKFTLFFEEKLKDKPIGDAVVEIGRSFLGTEYKANTLEINPDQEQLVINFTGLDCVTFVENCLTFARCVKMNKDDYQDFKKQLTKIRYRDGMIDGYGSRLHYFSDWIFDNQEKGIVTNITKELGGVEYDKNINFMSKHAKLYKQLEDKLNLQSIRIAEDAVNSRKNYFIPKDYIKDISDSLQNGDIIATTTNTDGLDVTHTGYVIKDDAGKTYFLHASLQFKEVIISKNTLSGYVNEDPKKTGIMVARPVEI